MVTIGDEFSAIIGRPADSILYAANFFETCGCEYSIFVRDHELTAREAVEYLLSNVGEIEMKTAEDSDNPIAKIKPVPIL